RLDREFGAGRTAAEDLADAGVLIVLHAEFDVRLRLVRRLLGVLDGVDGIDAHCCAPLCTFARPESPSSGAPDGAKPRKKPRPSVPGPVSASTACSGCGISPTTLPASLQMPAMSR